ncbi:fumarylacetoacetase [Streptomyces boncukensis]|uniref:fumarylacetoacetase n=1 Tax=Streptomyces boncukensis TaxID=2711219 RepID=A0A6G4WPQ3_9ACTN|nr:fumarylacetoacetase [Streptomyces boncukensis]NGO67185.1 fumarylacetoacetase [Streptomyces boncukensis]
MSAPDEPTGAAGLFGPDNLPYGLFTHADAPGHRRIGVRYHDRILDAGAAATALGSPHADLLTRPSLNALMAAGRAAWQAVRAELRDWLTDGAADPYLHPLAGATLHLPFDVADYVDFYASEHHATNLGRLFRPDSAPLLPNWKHLPVGYHGRSGTVVVSGTPVVRPRGQRKPPTDPAPSFGPSRRLDIEAELGFVVGMPSAQGGAGVGLRDFREHVFGVTLLNDWSARDLQGWEGQPLGPHLAKSFATSVSPWITPLDALEAARTAPPARDVPLLPYLDDGADGVEPGGLDLRLTVRLNGHTIAEPPFSAMYWTGAQMLAHMTAGGASLRTGDLYGSGTVSGPDRLTQSGCLQELTWGGAEPVELPDGKRTFLEDGDEVTLSGWAPGPGGERIGLGEVTGRVRPAPAA